MGTELIRVTEDLKQELEQEEGENFTDRIRSYADRQESKHPEFDDQELEKIKDKLERVNKKLTELKPLTQKEVDNVLQRYL